MYYSTESQIHINPARRENLSFISDRNLRKGQGTAPPWPPQLCCYYSFESREHCPTHFPPSAQLYEVAADHFSRGQTGQSKSRKVLQLLHFGKLLVDFLLSNNSYKVGIWFSIRKTETGRFCSLIVHFLIFVSSGIGK